jgi:hypothetical protein
MTIIKRFGLGTLILLVMGYNMSSCYKEEVNAAPKLVDYSISPKNPFAGDTVTISLNTRDLNGDEILYSWKSKTGGIISGENTKELTCKLPYEEGDFCCDLEISDRKAILDYDICVPVNGYIREDFVNPIDLWTSEEGSVSYIDEKATLTPSSTEDALLTFSFPDRIEPPYAVYMSVALNQATTTPDAADKYGLLLDFFNVGSDTIAKALWFRIYPYSNVKNWKVSLYKDVGSSGAWQNLDESALGISDQITTNVDAFNQIKMCVLEDNTLNIYVANSLVYTSTSLRDHYLSGTEAPKLLLEKIGLRTSSSKVSIDNVYVTKQMDVEFDDIFN